MADMERIHEFAVKWCDKFRNQKTHYLELIDHYMADDCAALGFVMDCGHAFSEKYGNAFDDSEELDKIIDDVDDIPLLGSAIYSKWRYFNHWAYSGEEILDPKNRAWFILALSRLALLAGSNPFIFKGEPRKIHIVSNNICFGTPPDTEDEIEQRLTINSDGRVWFSGYNFGEDFKCRQKTRSRIFSIDKSVSAKVLSSVARYFSDEYDELIAEDIGDWVMDITNTDGESYRFRGSLCAAFKTDGADLSDLIRDALGMNDLYVFDGNNEPDAVERISVDYHRVTKIKPKQPISQTAEYVTWDYSEKLILERESKTLEHILNIGDGCIVSRKMYIEGGVEILLDKIDAGELFGEIEGNPDDVVVNPLETQDYTITVDFKKGSQRIIQGTYDKKALPKAWGEFAANVWDFICFYGFGEILNPGIYGKTRRCMRDYIYCSVEFDGGVSTYYYIADDDAIEVGDYVVVPVGKDNHHSIAEVVKIEYFAEDDVPFPLEKTKHIIRKCTDDDFD